MAWTNERVQKLTLLWKNGKSASKIAIELGEGVSRNAVIGKIHRLGLSDRSSGTPTIDIKKTRKSVTKITSTNEQQPNFSDFKSNLEETVPKKGKKRGRKPSVKNILKNANNLNKGFEYNEKSIVGIGSLESEIDHITLANMRELETNAKKLNLLELTEKTCKWPIGDPATSEFWFCGHPSEQGKPYCKTHVSIAFQPITTRREKKQSKISS